jgi:hypothetical protein
LSVEKHGLNTGTGAFRQGMRRQDRCPHRSWGWKRLRETGPGPPAELADF